MDSADPIVRSPVVSQDRRALLTAVSAGVGATVCRMCDTCARRNPAHERSTSSTDKFARVIVITGTAPKRQAHMSVEPAPLPCGETLRGVDTRQVRMEVGRLACMRGRQIS
jgi:hypothetical protein